MDLDDLLTRAAPPVTARTHELNAELQALVRAAEPRAVRRRRVLVAGAVTAALLGTGVAAATGAGPLPGGWLTTSGGSQCSLEFFPVEPREVYPSGSPFTPAEQQATADVANEWLHELDLGSIDRDQAVKEWQAAEESARAGVVPWERQPKLHGDDLETQAVYYAVGQQLSAYLRSQGHDPDAVVTGMGWRCD